MDVAAVPDPPLMIPPIVVAANHYGEHSFSMCARFSGKLTFFTPRCAYLSLRMFVRKVSFSENFTDVPKIDDCIFVFLLLFIPLA